MTALTMDVREVSVGIGPLEFGSGVTVLTADEIDAVAGGPLPALAVFLIKGLVYTGVGATGAAAGVGLVLAVKEVVERVT